MRAFLEALCQNVNSGKLFLQCCRKTDWETLEKVWLPIVEYAASRSNSRILVNEMRNRKHGTFLRKGSSSSEPVAIVQRTEIAGSANLAIMETCAREVGLDALPNDLTRLLYLASLRDCNSGRYLHPELSPKIGVEEADRGLSACHDAVFQRLLTTPMSGYVLQLEEYICYTRGESNTLLKTWQSLQAYRATVPTRAHPISSELFCLNIEAAIAILKGARPHADTWSQEAPR